MPDSSITRVFSSAPLLAIQAIGAVENLAGVTTAIITFETKYATRPTVLVSRVDRIAEQVPNPVMTFMSDVLEDTLDHRVVVTGLTPSTHYEFIIEANGALKVAKAFGDFFTATRRASVIFEKLQIFLEEDEDMAFATTLYDGGTGVQLLAPYKSDIKYLGTQTFRDPFPRIDLAFAPDEVRLLVGGFDTDTPFPWPFTGFDGIAFSTGPDILPPGTPDGPIYHDSDSTILSQFLTSFTLGQFASFGLQSNQFDFVTALNSRYVFEVSGRLEWQVFDNPETVRRAKAAAALLRRLRVTALIQGP